MAVTVFTLEVNENSPEPHKKDRVVSKMEVTFFGQIIIFYDTMSELVPEGTRLHCRRLRRW